MLNCEYKNSFRARASTINHFFSCVAHEFIFPRSICHTEDFLFANTRIRADNCSIWLNCKWTLNYMAVDEQKSESKQIIECRMRWTMVALTRSDNFASISYQNKSRKSISNMANQREKERKWERARKRAREIWRCLTGYRYRERQKIGGFSLVRTNYNILVKLLQAVERDEIERAWGVRTSEIPKWRRKNTSEKESGWGD